MALLSPSLVGDTTMLIFELGRRTLTISATDAAWSTLLATMHLHLAGTKRPATWQLELIATAAPVDVYRR